MASIVEPSFDFEQDRPGFAYRRARLGVQAGAERLGASLYTLGPGQATFPYHYHFANEELLIVLRGQPHLRTPEGWRQLAEGEVVAFPVGERGAHQVMNRSDEEVRVLVLSEMIGPEVAVYPDSGKIAARAEPPGSTAGQTITGVFRAEDSVDYWEGETPPEAT